MFVSERRWQELQLEIERRVLEYINRLPEKDRRIIKEHLVQLENPGQVRDVELLRDGICRMHIAHSYTAFFTVFPDCVKILDVLTIEQAHKKYKRI